MNEDLQKERDRIIKKYGDKAATVGAEGTFALDVFSSGSLTFDYQSGLGGLPLGHAIEVFGAPSIGKTSLMGFNALREAEKAGLTWGVIALEPDFDEGWLVRNGIDLDKGIISYPDSGEEAFEILREWVYSGVVDYILFDSIGAVTSEVDSGEGGKSRVGGESRLISWGIKRVLMRARKNNVGIMFINQQRDKMNAKVAGVVDSPGGWAFKHAMKMRVQVKPGKERYYAKIDGEDIMIGREIVCLFIKAKAHNALGKTVKFDYYWVETEDNDLGIELGSDVISIAKITKVIEASGSWLNYPDFPKGKLQGEAKVKAFLAENPKVLEKIRNEVLMKMHESQARKKTAPELKAVEA